MSVTPAFTAVTGAMSARRALGWSVDALRLWGRAPFKLFLLCLMQFVVELVLQLIPWVGVTLSKVAVPLVIFGLLLGLDECARGGPMRWSSLFAGFRRRPVLPVLAMAAICGLSVFAVQQVVAWLVYGWPAVDAVWLGHVMAHPELSTMAFQRTLLLPGLLPSILLLLAPCLFLFDGLGPWQAVVRSVRTAVHFAAPFGILLLVNVALFLLMLTTPWALPLALLFTPWSVACMYVVWCDLRALESTPMTAD